MKCLKESIRDILPDLTTEQFETIDYLLYCEQQLKALQDAIIEYGVQSRTYLDSADTPRCCHCYTRIVEPHETDCKYDRLLTVLKNQGVV